MSSETNFATALANPSIRSVLKPFVSTMKWDSKLAQKVSDFFSQDSIAGTGIVSDAIIRSHFTIESFLEPEIESVLSKCKAHVELGNNIDGFLKIFSTFYKRKMVAEIISETQRNPIDQAEEVIRRIGEMPRIEAQGVRVENLGHIDIDRVIAEEYGTQSTLPTSFPIIQDAMPLGGYLRGSVVQICGSPGTGKSLFLMNEAVTLARAGLKGLYVALGDLMRMDLINRFSSLITQAPLTDTMENPKRYWTNEVQSILSHIRIIVVPAGTMDSDSLADLIESRVQEEENIDFIMVDYDSNFQKTKESMYEEGDVVYNKMSTLARPTKSQYRLVFIASQPKQAFWKFEIIPMEAAAESARKQAIIDLMITLGKSIGSSVKCGKINIPKNRRGPADLIRPYRVTDCGQIVEITDAEYTMIQGFSSEDNSGRKKRVDYNSYYSNS